MQLRAYLQLLRPANVTTVLADVLAGYAVAGLGHRSALPWLLFATAGLYGGGVVLNDFFDRKLDALERPERPIPSGRVRPAGAAWLGVLCLAAGVASACRASTEAGVIACAIAVLVIAYDTWSKRHNVLGPVTMGACRGLNLVLGMAAVPAVLAVRWELAVLPFSYICAVTALSRGEVHGGSRRIALLALAAVGTVIAVLLALALRSGPRAALAGLLTGLLAWRVLPALWRAYDQGGAATIRSAVKAGVLSLVMLDAAVAAIYAGTFYGVLVLAVALLAGGLSRLFAVT